MKATKFVKIEEKEILNEKQRYVHIKIKDANQFIPFHKAIERIQPLSEEMKQDHKFEVGKL